ncbi:peptidase S8/S53 domain-containing protein [Tribonema minus]|uniref:subtilisin n=1 Tax=Tribonema minus TaxID=303371 RepID=A0A835YSQ6_9STRA|nr:peptidase S8/S53 domain-containing protein [Tribonema minus]
MDATHGRALLHSDGPSSGVTHIGAYPAELKLHSKLLDAARNSPAHIKAVVVHMSPGQGARSAAFADAVRRRWWLELGALAAMQGGLQALSFWSSTVDDEANQAASAAAAGGSGDAKSDDMGGRHWRRRLVAEAAAALERELDAAAACGWSAVTVTSTRDGVLHLGGLQAVLRGGLPSATEGMSPCFMVLLTYLSAQHDVAFISHRGAITPRNYVGTQLTQGGAAAGERPLWDRGITGAGQASACQTVVGLVDTGVDDASCYFKDPARAQVTRGTIASPVTDMAQRKVVQYLITSDGTDTWGGHGTHTAGSIAGALYGGWAAPPPCGAGTLQSCWGECMTDAMCRQDTLLLLLLLRPCEVLDGVARSLRSTRCCATQAESSSEVAWQWSEDTISDDADAWTCARASQQAAQKWPFMCPAYGCGAADASTCGADAATVRNQAGGNAPGAKLAVLDVAYGAADSLDVPDALADAFDAARVQAGARIHSNSWATSTPCSYDDLTLQADQYMYDHPESLVVFVAGNEGMDGDCSIATPGGSKNVLTVGASTSGPTRSFSDVDIQLGGTDAVAFFSSIGPTYDGRIKPDVVAPGNYVLSAAASKSTPSSDETCAATAMRGTSMYYVDGFYKQDLDCLGLCADPVTSSYDCSVSKVPSAALVKATIIDSAHGLDNGVAKPNAQEGHGRVALAATLPLGATAAALFAHDGSIGVNGAQAFALTVMAGATEASTVSLTLTWTDPPATVASAYQVLHDLDVVVVRASDCAVTYANGYAGLEYWNSVERVTLPLSGAFAAGDQYTALVFSYELVASATQAFALVVSGPVTVVAAPPGVTDPTASGCAPAYAALDAPPADACTVVDGYPDCCLPRPEWAAYVGDGRCNEMEHGAYAVLNTEACGYDGGDCCPWTCDNTKGLCGYFSYNCVDPAWSCCASSLKLPPSDPTFVWVGDGYCDSKFNVQDCGYDLGDCCKACCDPILSPTSYYAPVRTCGDNGYACHDANCNLQCDRPAETCGAAAARVLLALLVQGASLLLLAYAAVR